MITTLATVAFTLFQAAAAPATRPTPSPSTPDSVDAFVAAEMARMHIPGVAIAVVKSGKVVVAKGYGMADVEAGVPVTPTTVFKIGSVSKQFIATGIMLLAQDGRLSVDDPVSNYLAGTPESWRGITLRHFLTHTSGVLREGPAFNPLRIQPDSVVVQSAYSQPLQFPTGARYQYCNVCYFALADVISRVSNTSWADFLTRRVFAPEGMTSTQTTTSEPVPGSAKGYVWRDARFAPATQFTALRPSGAFLSTVLDLAKWDAALYRDDVLTRATRQAMWTPVQLTTGATYAYGFGWQLDSLDGHRTVSHGGSLPGFRAEMARFVDDSLTVIVLTNADGAQPATIAAGVARAWFAAARPRSRR
ncbi:MAG: beta-lactamase family protein [Gemmatimonadaceae bacterium]|nr:beta-lactamase family protein [Gemmatimonadaceae bacterium]